MTSHRATITVHFEGGPWHGQTYNAATVTAPVFAAGSATGRDYWLDQNSDPPTYHWRPEAHVLMTGRGGNRDVPTHE